MKVLLGIVLFGIGFAIHHLFQDAFGSGLFVVLGIAVMAFGRGKSETSSEKGYASSNYLDND